MKNDFLYGFRILGGVFNDRNLVLAGKALDGYSRCDPFAKIDCESYLSAFRFDKVFADYLTEKGSPKGYTGPTWSEWLWFDIDRDDLTEALKDVRKLVAWLFSRFGTLAGDELLLFYSGSKGFHVGIQTELWRPDPAINFHDQCRCFAETIAEQAEIAIDSGVYDRVRAFRAPNSRHQKTGRHKRFLELSELMTLEADEITRMAESPRPFTFSKSSLNREAVRMWYTAASTVEERQKQIKQRRIARTSNGDAGFSYLSVTRATMDFIRNGATSGDRHRRLFSAAANLGEFGCNFELAWALLSESALDCGLSPSDVRRQIECGLTHGGSR